MGQEIEFNSLLYNLLSKSEVMTRKIETGTFTKSKNYFIYYKRRFYEMDTRLIKYVQFLIDIAVLYPNGGNEYYGERTYQLDSDMWKKSLKDRIEITSDWLSKQESILSDDILSGIKSQYRNININSLNI